MIPGDFMDLCLFFVVINSGPKHTFMNIMFNLRETYCTQGDVLEWNIQQIISDYMQMKGIKVITWVQKLCLHLIL